VKIVQAKVPAKSPWRVVRPSRALPSAAVVLSVVLAAGCQQSTQTSGAPVVRASITVGAIRGVGNAPLYIAASNGLFASAGLHVTIRPYQSVASELKALNSGSVDVATGDYVDFFEAQATSRHPDLRIVADGYHAAPGVMEVLTIPGSGVTSPADLKGKTVGTPEPQGIKRQGNKPYSLETLATQSVLSNDGVNPASVIWRPMPVGDLITALATKKVSAILVQEPYIFQAESRLGAVVVLDSCSGATANLPLSGYFAVNAFAAKHAQVLREFRSALEQAQASAVLPGPVRVVLSQEPGMSMQSATLVTIGTYPTSLNAASLQRVSDLMFSFLMIGGALNVAPMIAH
jgi:NitT/TauT family transport system substrate-binding protein